MTETRWLIIAADGRHVTLGRAAPPSDDEVMHCAERLVAQGIAGAWFVELHGAYWGRRRVALVPIRQIVPGAQWQEAERRFQAIRRSAQPKRAPRDTNPEASQAKTSSLAACAAPLHHSQRRE